MIRVLIIEDDPQIRRFLRIALEGEGCHVQEAARLDVGLAAALLDPDFVLLDLGLPDGDGLNFIISFRKRSQAPIVVISARGQEADKVAALDGGADDYLVKPFGVAELLARTRVQIRRQATSNAPRNALFHFGDVSVNLDRCTVERAGAPLRLTPMEYRLLTYFISHAGRVLTHRQILRDVWGPGYTEGGHTLRVYVGRLRHRLEADPTRPKYLLTETGVGYRLEIT